MSNLFTQISEAARKQQEQLQRARFDSPNSDTVQPEPTEQSPREAGSNTDTSVSSKNADTKSSTSAPNKPVAKRKTTAKSPKQKPNGRTVAPHGTTERSKQSPKTSYATPILPTSISIDSLPHSVIGEMADGMSPDAKRTTERYSFEIYSDQKHSIRKLQMTYEYQTGKHLPKSRIIREALDAYLNSALKKAA